MTDEKRNEIWAMLPEDFRREATAIYKTWVSGSAASAMIELFGKHNLTAQAEEKPKEDVEASIISQINPQGGIHVSPSEEFILLRDIDYQQYRLDLAKEIAVKLIEINKICWTELGQDAVNLTNEIVKRLKETENVI